MKTKLFASLGDGIALSAVLAFFLSVPVAAQTHFIDAVPALAVSSVSPQLPSGTKIIAQVPLPGQPVTRMYTQSEYGRTYLYLEHGELPFTTVDITRKKSPQIVNHAPGNIEPGTYEELFEGGTIDVAPQWEVSAGLDNIGGRGMRSVLESSSPNDKTLLQAFGTQYANLVDGDRRVVFFASPSQLVVVQDNRLTAIDFIGN
jgi:hypothetical protein